MNATCSIDGCSNRVRVKEKGWCNAHYERWRKYGDPFAGSTARGALQRYFQDVVLTHVGDDCLIWPFGKSNGYAVWGRGGGSEKAYRIVCEAVHGRPPTPQHYALHSCGKGHLGCVSPHHLRWGTQQENVKDMIEHGTIARGDRLPQSKLSETEVCTIRRSSGKVRQRDLAAIFGVCQQTISDIQRGKRWTWLEDAR